MKLSNISLKNPGLIFSFIILLITFYFVFQNSEKTEKSILEKLEEQKKAIEEKIETLNKEKNWMNVTKGGDLIERKYYEGEILLATDRLNENGIIIRRDYYDISIQVFATDYYNQFGKIDYTRYYDKFGEVISTDYNIKDENTSEVTHVATSVASEVTPKITQEARPMSWPGPGRYP